VALVLPPQEAFAPGAAGAIALLARRLATPHDGFEPLVIGTPPPLPAFAAVPFRAVRPAFWGGYAGAVGRALRVLRPALVEVHNRPALAWRLRRHGRVALFLNNDPCEMPGARTSRERAALLEKIAVVTSSEYLRERFLAGLAGHVDVLANCLDFRELPPPALRENLVLFAGRMVADKGADTFVRCRRCRAGAPP